MALSPNIITTGFSEATRKRRSNRALEPKTTVPDSTVIKLAEEAILTVPSAFNSQSARLTVVFGSEHRKLWSIAGDVLPAKIGEERWQAGFKDKVANYSNAYGTILFWDDQSVATAMNQNVPDFYKDKTEDWVQQANGMHQYYLWTALDSLGFGVNLQHLNPMIDDEVKKVFSVPSTWRMSAQMVFGVPKEGTSPGEKPQKLPLEQRLQVIGSSSML